MADQRNFIEQTQARAKAYHGKELSPSEMATEFAKFGIDDRANSLDLIDRDLASGEPLSIREATKLRSYVNALRKTHETLRKVGR
jgi:hypothetical protein